MEIEKRLIPPEELFPLMFSILEEKNQAAFTVTGMSMWPFLCHGRDKVIVEKCDVDKIQKGDVVLFQTHVGNYMMHRVTKVTKEEFETTGDGNCFRDGFFPKKNIRAKIVKMIRKDKTMDCSSLCWRTVFRFWMICFPIRRYLLMILRKVAKLRN